MAQEDFNVSEPNDGLGDKLRAAFIKVQNNFTDLFNGKVDKEAGKGLSTNDYTTTDKDKLLNIEAFAERNVQSDAAQQDSTQPDFIKNFPSFPFIPEFFTDRVISRGTATIVDETVVFSVGFIWDIDNENYQNIFEITQPLLFAAAGNFRTDVAYLNANSEILIVAGTESTIVTPEPAIPTGTIRLMNFNIFGAAITPEVPANFRLTVGKENETPFENVNQILFDAGFTVTGNAFSGDVLVEFTGSNATLQSVTAGANKNLIDGIFQAGTFAGNGQTGVNVNQIGQSAGENNEGESQNAFGQSAGADNTGNNQNAFGVAAGAGNTGNHQNALGVNAGGNNIGLNQNAFGEEAGFNNTFNDVNLFGFQTRADEHGQTVFRSAGGFMNRLSTLLLTDNRKYVFPDKSGTFAMLDDVQTLTAGTNITIANNVISSSGGGSLPNPTTAGNVLRANGTEFLSIPEVEFMRNLAIYQKAPDSKFFDNKQLIAWDSFDRPDADPIIQSDSGHNYSTWRGLGIGRIFNKTYIGNDTAGFGESVALITVSPTKNIGIEFSFTRATNANLNTGIFIIKNDSNYFYFGRSINPNGTVFPELPQSTDYRLVVVINNVATVLGSIALTSIYGGGNNDGFTNSRLNFVIKYGNRGRNDASRITVQSLDTPAQRFDVDVATYNSTFETPSDYNRIAITANRVISIQSYKIANLDL